MNVVGSSGESTSDQNLGSGDNVVFNQVTTQSVMCFPEIAPPGASDTNEVCLYAKTDKYLYFKDDGGTERKIGSSSATTLQQAYSNSVGEPEILTDATQGSVSIRRGSAADTDTVFDIQNGAGTTTFSVNGLGDVISGNLQVGGQAYSPTNTLTDTATITTDCNLGNVHTVTLGGNRTLGAPTNLQNGATYIWIIKQPAVGGPYTLAYNSVFKFESGSAPILSVGANDIDILTGVSDGVNVYGSMGLNYS